MIIEKKLLPLQPFVIPVKGLKAGENDFLWKADGKFFEAFGNSEIQDADLDIRVHVVNEDFGIEADCSIDGTVTVLCDRCLGELEIPVSVEFSSEGVYDLNQDIYDEVCLSLPLTKVHPDGGCDEGTIRFLSK